MAPPAAVDWSWGQAYTTPTLDALTRDTNSHPSPQSDTQYHFDQHLSQLQHPRPQKPTDPFPNGFQINNALRTAVPSPAISETMQPLSLQPAPPLHARTPSFAGRKRSCAEISDVDDSSSDPHSASTRSGGPSGSPIKYLRTNQACGYSEGNNSVPRFEGDMETSNSSTSMDTSRDVGVWAEDLAERLRSSSFPGGVSRPRFEDSRKSMRLEPSDSNASTSLVTLPEHSNVEHCMMLDENEASSAQHPNKRRNTHTCTPHAQSNPYSSTNLSASDTDTITTTHDEARLTLGIGWSTLASTPIMLAAARGWGRHVENAFNLPNARVLWRNEGLGAFLISAGEDGHDDAGRGGSDQRRCGYYLFDEALTQGRLVAWSWEEALRRLKVWPVEFEGGEVLGVRSERGIGNGNGSGLGMLDEGVVVHGGNDDSVGGRGSAFAPAYDGDDRYMGMEIE